MAEVPGTLEGWFALHDFRKLDWARWKAVGAQEKAAILEEAVAFLNNAEQAADVPEGSSACYAIVGHKSDLMFLHLRPTLAQLGAIERGFNQTRLADFTTQSYSYVSVTELSLYEAYARGGSEDAAELAQSPFVQKRLKPQIPDMPYIGFYPMNKKRGEVDNWYSAGMEERRAMMRQHATTGRKYHDQITQMITGSTGLDDWEWGVTLFAVDALPIKKLVYEMRFDEVTAKYGEFGEFQVGTRVPAAKLPEILG